MVAILWKIISQQISFSKVYVCLGWINKFFLRRLITQVEYGAESVCMVDLPFLRNLVDSRKFNSHKFPVFNNVGVTKDWLVDLPFYGIFFLGVNYQICFLEKSNLPKCMCCRSWLISWLALLPQIYLLSDFISMSVQDYNTMWTICSVLWPWWTISFF